MHQFYTKAVFMNMNFTQKHNLMNIYCKSMRLLPFEIVQKCATQSVPLLHIYHDWKKEKWCVAKMAAANFETTDKNGP